MYSVALFNSFGVSKTLNGRLWVLTTRAGAASGWYDCRRPLRRDHLQCSDFGEEKNSLRSNNFSSDPKIFRASRLRHTRQPEAAPVRVVDSWWFGLGLGMAVPRSYSGNGAVVNIEDAENITRNECLALIQTGKDNWNAWRNGFPVRKGIVNGNLNFQNRADFSNHCFLNDIDCSGFQFGESAAFVDTEFGGAANFDDAVFGEWANFSRTYFAKEAGFRRTHFHGDAIFVGVKFDGHVSFVTSRIDGPASFLGTSFAGNAMFTCARFEDRTEFSGMHVNGWADFSGAVFGGSAKFTAARFSGWANFRFYSSAGVGFSPFKDAVELDFFKHRRGRDALSFGDIDFDGAVFEDIADFSGRKFEGAASFSALKQEFRTHCVAVKDGHIQRASKDEVIVVGNQTSKGRAANFAMAPLFHECKLHQNTNFDGAVFPMATGSSEAARAYRTLKLAFAQQQAIREEQRFFKLEMTEETKAAESSNDPRRRLYILYREFADFGFSVWRPLNRLILLPGLGCMLCYLFLMMWPHSELRYSPLFEYPSLANSWIKFSFGNLIPLPDTGLLKDLRVDLFGKDSAASTFALVIETVQRLLAFLGYFLIGLALRNLFKMK